MAKCPTCSGPKFWSNPGLDVLQTLPYDSDGSLGMILERYFSLKERYSLVKAQTMVVLLSLNSIFH